MMGWRSGRGLGRWAGGVGLAGTHSEVYAQVQPCIYMSGVCLFSLGRAHSLSLGRPLRPRFGIDSVQQKSRMIVSSLKSL